MPSNLVFTPPKGIGYPLKCTPRFATITRTPANLRGQLRVSLTPYPIWDVEFTFGYLKGSAQSNNSSYQYLQGFIMAMGGSSNSFLWQHPADNTVTPAGTEGSTTGFIGIGDGATASFQLIRQISIGNDIVQNPATVTLYLNGTPQPPTAWTQNYAGVVTFGTPPTTGAVITWGGTFYFRLHFTADSLTDLEMNAPNYWNWDGGLTVACESVIL